MLLFFFLSFFFFFIVLFFVFFFFFSSRRRHTRCLSDWSSECALPIYDRQHPHDLFMEASLTYRRPLSDWLGAELYLAPVGEPALGPPAFMHRASAEGDPFPPLSHHWQDSTHVSFGVATAGLYTRQLKLEGSWFNGREPDEDRWNFDFRPLDSFSLRLSANPVRPVSLQVPYGYLAS